MDYIEHVKYGTRGKWNEWKWNAWKIERVEYGIDGKRNIYGKWNIVFFFFHMYDCGFEPRSYPKKVFLFFLSIFLEVLVGGSNPGRTHIIFFLFFNFSQSQFFFHINILPNPFWYSKHKKITLTIIWYKAFFILFFKMSNKSIRCYI